VVAVSLKKKFVSWPDSVVRTSIGVNL